jgi:hypothetical protein
MLLAAELKIRVRPVLRPVLYRKNEKWFFQKK